MDIIKNLLKGVVAGIGGIAPGLSGSVLLVIMGLYEKTIHALGTLFQNFKKNVRFLLPLVIGMGCGVLLFSKIVDFLLGAYEMQTRFAFLGLVLGTVPLFYQQVRKKGFRNRYYFVVFAAGFSGLLLFGSNGGGLPVITQPNLLQSVLLGVAVAGSSIVPGVDSAVILSSLGLYELYVQSLAQLNLQVLLPACVGLVVGAAVISFVMNLLLKYAYTFTFSVIFGLFISIIPNVLGEHMVVDTFGQGVVAVSFALAGCLLSYYLGDIPGNNARLKKMLKK